MNCELVAEFSCAYRYQLVCTKAAINAYIPVDRGCVWMLLTSQLQTVRLLYPRFLHTMW